MSIRIL